MSNLFKVKSFKYGFILGVFLFLIIQLFDYANYIFQKENLKHFSQTSSISIDVIWHWGLPFPIFYGGDFIISGLLIDVLIALIFSFILGLVFKLAWSKNFSRRMK